MVVGSAALLLGSGLQMTFVVILLGGGIAQPLIPALAITGGLATMGMVAAIRAWIGQDWGIDVSVAIIQMMVGPWLFGFGFYGLGLIVIFSVALIGLANGRAWFRRPDEPIG